MESTSVSGDIIRNSHQKQSRDPKAWIRNLTQLVMRICYGHNPERPLLPHELEDTYMIPFSEMPLRNEISGLS